jgi:hypothetical protein
MESSSPEGFLLAAGFAVNLKIPPKSLLPKGDFLTPPFLKEAGRILYFKK